jgi:hypothetical protein
VQVQIDVAAVADKHTVLGSNAVLLEDVDLVEQVGNVDDAAGADEVHTSFSENAGGCESVRDEWCRRSRVDSRRM